MASSVLSFVLLGNSASAERALQRVGAEAETTATRTERASARMHNSFANAFNKVGKLATVAMVGIGVEAVRAASKFESAMTMVHTQAGASNAEVAKLGKQILDLAPKVGVGPERLAESLYHVESAGFRGAKAMSMVAAAAKLSMIGNTDIETASQAIIATMASGIKGVRDANDATALLNTTVGVGDMRMQDLAKSLGSGVLPVARQLGLSFEDVASAAATMTDNATNPLEVMTRMKTALLTLIKPTSQQAQAFSQIGMSTLQLSNDFQKPNGLLVAVQDLKKHLEATYPAGQSTKLSLEQIQKASQAYYNDLVTQGTNAKDATKLTKAYTQQITEGGSATVLAANNIARALGGSKTAGVFLTLISQSERLTDKYKQFGDATSRARKLAEAWAKQQETAKQKLADVKAAWDVFLVRMGNAILPTLKKVLDVLAKHPAIMKDVVIGIAAMAAAFTAWKIGNFILLLERLAQRILFVGTASTTAAAETEAANLGGAVGRGAGVAGGGRGLSAVGKIVVPVAITYAVLKATGSDKFYQDLFKGQFSKALNDAPKYGKEFGARFSRAFNGQLYGELDPVGMAARKLHDKQNDLAGQLSDVNRKILQAYLTGDTGAVTELEKRADELRIKMEQAGEDSGKGYLGKFLQALQASKKLFDSVFPGDAPLAAAGVQGAMDGGAYSAALLKKFLEARQGSQLLFNTLFPGLESKNQHTVAAGGASAATAGLVGQQAAAAKTAAITKYLTALQAAASRENDNYAGSLAAANDKLKLNAALLSTGAVAGVDNTRAIRGAVTAVDEHAIAVYRQTGNLWDARRAFHDGIKTIEDNMVALGFNRDTANQLVQQLVGVKNNSHLDIEVIANGTFNLKDLFASGAIGGAAGGAAAAFASGGHVRGPGTGTSDSIPAYLSAGEYVMPAHVVKQMGVGFFDGLRTKRFAAGGLAGFDAQFPPTMNRHVEGLETAMNASAQKWFASRRNTDMGSFIAQSAGAVGAGVTRWIPLILQVLSMLGQSPSLLPNVLAQMNLESGGNPLAINLWDSNAMIGQPSKGLMQTIDATFAAYAGPFAGLGIYNPLANIYAGLNYAAHTGGIARLHGTQGYANGTTNAARGWRMVGERGPELVNFRGGETVLRHGQTPGGDTFVINIPVSTHTPRDTRDWLQREGAQLIVEAIARRKGR